MLPNADERLRRLYALVEADLTDLDDVLSLKGDRDAARAALDRARSANRPPAAIDPARIEAFGSSMCERLTKGEIAFRKAYLGAILDRFSRVPVVQVPTTQFGISQACVRPKSDRSIQKSSSAILTRGVSSTTKFNSPWSRSILKRRSLRPLGVESTP